MKKIDAPLLAYIKPFTPADCVEYFGFSVIDVETLRIWYFNNKKIKASFMVKAPLPSDLE